MDSVRACPYCHRSLRGDDLHCRRCEADVDARHGDPRYHAAEAEFLVAQRRSVREAAAHHGLTHDDLYRYLVDRGILLP